MEKEEGIFRFEELRVYQKALDYVDWVVSITKTFAQDDISIPIKTSARQIALSIAEGSGESKQQFINNLKDAKCALRECVVFTTIAKRQNLISELAEDESRARLIELSKMLSGFITSILNKERAPLTPGFSS